MTSGYIGVSQSGCACTKTARSTIISDLYHIHHVPAIPLVRSVKNKWNIMLDSSTKYETVQQPHKLRRIRMRNRCFAALTAVVLLMLVLAGCGGGGGSNQGGTIYLRLTDAPLAGVEKVEITISKIVVHKSGSGPITLKEFETPVTIDLLEYRYDGTDSSTYPLLSDTPLTAGHYTWVRLEITEASVTVDGVERPIDVTKLPQRGIQFIHPFDVADSDKTGLLLDFNAGKSIKFNNGVYSMNPVTYMVPIVLAGSVKGTVEFKDASGDVVAVPEGSTVDAYNAGTTTLAGSAIIAEDGTFAIPALTKGEYDLKIDADGYDGTVVVKSGVVVTSGDLTDVGTISVSTSAAP